MKLSLLSVAVIAVLLPLGHSGAVTQQQPCATSLADCPKEGCSTGDPELNKQKNRTEAPETVTAMTLSRIRAWNEPSSWPKGKERSSLAFREDKAVIVKAFLRDARVSGKETTNCKLSGEHNNDFHLDLISFRDAPKATAVTAEITPRLRRAGWDIDKLKFLGEEKYYVRVSGWLMLDTAHIGNPIVRSSNWEIHPVTMLEVCTKTKPKCDQEQGWVLLEDFEIP
jgi:hypothetical protein